MSGAARCPVVIDGVPVKIPTIGRIVHVFEHRADAKPPAPLVGVVVGCSAIHGRTAVDVVVFDVRIAAGAVGYLDDIAPSHLSGAVLPHRYEHDPSKHGPCFWDWPEITP